MRQIKFRQLVDGEMRTFGFIPTKYGMEFWGAPKSSTEDYPVMQFTGIKDANGVDIYEGDVVRDHVGVGVVEYSDKKAAFRVNYNDGFAKWFIDYTLSGERDSIVVIGDIHHEIDGALAL